MPVYLPELARQLALMRTPHLLLTCAALQLLGCTTSRLVPPGDRLANALPGPRSWETWMQAGLGSHWPARSASLGPNGELAVAAGERVLLHDLATGRDLQTFVIPGAKEDAQALAERDRRPEPALTAISPDGSLIAAAAGDRLAVFGRDAALPVTTLRLEFAPYQLAFSADGTRLVILGANRRRSSGLEPSQMLQVLDARTGSAVSSLRFTFAETVRILSDLVVVERTEPTQATKSFEVRRLSGEAVGTWSFSDGELAAFAPDGQRAAVAGRDGSLRLVERGNEGTTTDAKTLWTSPVEGSTKALVFQADGRRLLVFRERSDNGRDEVVRIDSASGRVESTQLWHYQDTPVVSPEGSWALANQSSLTSSPLVCELGSASPNEPRCASHLAIDALSERAGRVVGSSNWSESVAFDPRTGSAAPLPPAEKSSASCSGCRPAVTAGHELVVIDWRSPNRAVALPGGEYFFAVYERGDEPATRAVAADGDCLMLYETDKTHSSGWDEGVCLTSPGSLDGQVLLSADNRWALAVGTNDVLTLWDLEQRRLEQVFSPPEDSAGGTILAALTDDGVWAFARQAEEREERLSAWRRGTAAPRWSFPIKDAAVEAVALRPGSEQLAAALNDGRVMLFDAESGEPAQLVDLAPNLDYPKALYWLADGKTLVVGTSRGAVMALRR